MGYPSYDQVAGRCYDATHTELHEVPGECVTTAAKPPELVAKEDEARILANTQRPIGELTERELLEEQTYWLRTTGQALKEFQTGGMGKVLSGMLGGALGTPRR